jgi:hypothetical protein
MALITLALATPVALTANRFERLNAVLALLTGLASVLFGAALIYEIGFAKGLFSSHPRWSPE